MCGIFGVALGEPISMARVFTLLEKLEVHQYPQEPRPVGGYGAGVAILDSKRSVMVEKVGKVDVSPAKHLSSLVKIENACVVLGHVRMPTPQFMEKARFKETSQPYAAKCFSDSVIVSVHNGYVTNYKEIRMKLDKAHLLESEKAELVDSEVIPHFFEELLEEKPSSDEAVHALYSLLEGSNTIGLLQVGKEGRFLHLIQKGKTRGLFVWTNDSGEIVFCSRKEPIMEHLDDLLTSLDFKERISIPFQKDDSLKVSFKLDLMTA